MKYEIEDRKNLSSRAASPVHALLATAEPSGKAGSVMSVMSVMSVNRGNHGTGCRVSANR